MGVYSTVPAREPARLELRADGVIVECSDAAARVLGFERDALRGEHVSRVFPGLGAVPLLNADRVNPELAFLCRWGRPLDGVRADGARIEIAALPYALRRTDGARVVLAWETLPAPPAAGRRR